MDTQYSNPPSEVYRDFFEQPGIKCNIEALKFVVKHSPNITLDTIGNVIIEVSKLFKSHELEMSTFTTFEGQQYARLLVKHNKSYAEIKDQERELDRRTRFLYKETNDLLSIRVISQDACF